MSLVAAEPGPENLALKASSEYSEQYLARFAIDGVVPDQDGRNDVGHAWCIKGKTASGKADFAAVTLAKNKQSSCGETGR